MTGLAKRNGYLLRIAALVLTGAAVVVTVTAGFARQGAAVAANRDRFERYVGECPPSRIERIETSAFGVERNVVALAEKVGVEAERERARDERIVAELALIRLELALLRQTIRGPQKDE